jgi:hypothetical protein
MTPGFVAQHSASHSGLPFPTCKRLPFPLKKSCASKFAIDSLPTHVVFAQQSARVD